jgi:aryl-alcohol dehydrogenase-like predicted oxidoreductase
VKYRQLGSSDMKVSEIALGSWMTFGGGVEAKRSEACVRRALELGINFIDTANVYSGGEAERFLGRVLAPVDRKSYFIATKLFFPMSPQDHGLSRAQIEKQLDASLKRLQLDHVDLYQCHRYDPETPLAETLEALTAAVKSGKTRYVGFSEWQPKQIQAALDTRDVTRFVSSQPQYSMLWRNPETAVLPLCSKNGISQIVWSPLAQGVLTGKYLPGKPVPTDSRAASDQMGGFLRGDLLSEGVLQGVQRLGPIAQAAGLTLTQLALAWVLRQPNVASAIVGATRPEQVEANATASGVTLSAETLAACDEALRDVGR